MASSIAVFSDLACSDSEPRVKRARPGLSPIAKLNCLAVVCLLKLCLGALILFRWQGEAQAKLEPVLMVRALVEDRPLEQLPAPPQITQPNMPVITLAPPQFTVQSTAAISPPAMTAPSQTVIANQAPAQKVDPNPYYQQVLRQIAQHKRYPVAAKRARQQGLVEVSFEIGADGKLLSAQVMQTSENPSLDAAALAAVTQASPFPPIPAELALQRLSLTLPIEFSLR